MRVELCAKLDGAQLSLQIDIGFGDVVTPAPETVSYPVLLDDLPAPTLRAYPKYTVVAEKFQALCALGMANSRMKDYFDLWMLLRDADLDDAELVRAIQATFTRRRTALPGGVAGVELTLLDCVRYFHKAAGINGVAQIAKDIGAKANPRTLAKAAAAYENSAVRRLGYLLERAGHGRQARALEPFVKQAKTTLPLDPAVKPIVAALAQVHERNAKWKLMINETVEVAE